MKIHVNPSNKNLHHPRSFDIIKFYFIIQCWALYGNVEFTKNFYGHHKLGNKQNKKHCSFPTYTQCTTNSSLRSE